MGIPHIGHIDYMSKILDLGYKLIISIQRAYTITDRDPIPKWLVMKMVARSLINLGYSEEDFQIFLTPFYRTDQELKTHFAMMPGKKIVATASSNSDIHGLFSGPLIKQEHVFCKLHNDRFVPKSWGEMLRSAVKDNDYALFKNYVANGVEEILSFEELRAQYGIPPIEFVPGIVKAVVDDQISIRVSRYSTPEESLVKRINELSNGCKMIDPYAKHSVLKLNGKRMKLSYERIEFDGENELIHFKLINQEVI
jgi:hypothetical protein